MSRELGEELARFRPHQHLCLIFESADEWKAAVVPFLLLELESSPQPRPVRLGSGAIRFSVRLIWK